MLKGTVKVYETYDGGQLENRHKRMNSQSTFMTDEHVGYKRDGTSSRAGTGRKFEKHGLPGRAVKGASGKKG